MCDEWGNAKDEVRENLLARSKTVIRELDVILKSPRNNTNVRSPIDTMKRLIGDKVILPIGDIIGGKVRIKPDYFERYETILESLKVSRLPREKKRSVEDAVFHYKVDSLNTVLSPAIGRERSGMEFFFATPQKENLENSMWGDNSYGRYPYVPLFILNATILEHKGHTSSRSVSE